MGRIVKKFNFLNEQKKKLPKNNKSKFYKILMAILTRNDGEFALILKNRYRKNAFSKPLINFATNLREKNFKREICGKIKIIIFSLSV